MKKSTDPHPEFLKAMKKKDFLDRCLYCGCNMKTNTMEKIGEQKFCPYCIQDNHVKEAMKRGVKIEKSINDFISKK